MKTELPAAAAMLVARAAESIAPLMPYHPLPKPTKDEEPADDEN